MTRAGVSPQDRGPPRCPAVIQKTRRTSSPKTFFRRYESIVGVAYQATRASPGPDRKITPALPALTAPACGTAGHGGEPAGTIGGNGTRAFRVIPANLARDAKVKVTRD